MPASITNSYGMSITRSYARSLEESGRMSGGNRKIFGRNFRRALAPTEYAKYTNDALGTVFAVSGATISNWRNGIKLPDIDHAVDIALKFNVCVEWLLTGRGPRAPKPAYDSRLEDVIALWPKLSASDQDTLRVLAEHKAQPPDPTPRPKNDKPPRPKHKVN